MYSFNSAFYSSIATNDYNVIFVTEDYSTGANFSLANGANSARWQPPGWDGPSTMQPKAMRGEYERLENKACIEAYAAEFLTDRRHLIVVSNNASLRGNGAVLDSGNFEYQTPQRDKELAKGFDPYPWYVGASSPGIITLRTRAGYAKTQTYTKNLPLARRVDIHRTATPMYPESSMMQRIGLPKTGMLSTA